MAREQSVKDRIAIIGGGHLGSALANGLVRGGMRPTLMSVSGPSVTGNRALKKLCVLTTRDNCAAAAGASWIFLAVKPAIVSTVLDELKPVLDGKVLISLAAGVQLGALQKMAPQSHVARVIPNIPIAISQGVSVYLVGNLAAREKKDLVRILSSLGVAIPVRSDDELDVVTLLSGCGPGIVSFFIAALADAAKTLGLSDETANSLSLQTFSGTLGYLEHTRKSPQELMQSVATKGGITEEILAALDRRGLKKIVARALARGHARIKGLEINNPPNVI